MSRISEASIQHLAHQDWVLIPEFFSPVETREIQRLAQAAWQQGQFKPARIGRTREPARESEIRSDWTLWLEPSEARFEFIFQRIEHLRQQLNEALFLGLQDFEGHFARYAEGQFYDRHLDQLPPAPGNAPTATLKPRRVISFVFYLNENWRPEDGGELCLFEPETRVEPRWGQLVLFRSDTVPHAVMKSWKERWSLTGWFRRI